MTLKTRKINKNRSKLFGVVINPKLDKTINWESLSIEELDNKLKEIKFLDKSLLTKYLNDLKIENVSKNLTSINNFVGQAELEKNSKIPHYQLAIEMKKYCTKNSDFISVEYSGKLYKHEWEIDFLDRKPILRKVLQNPFKWQEFVRKELLSKISDDRTVDWIIDPVGNTGKSSFARASVSEILTDGVLMKIDNLDRMELTLIKKIENYRMKHYKDPKVIFFDFPRASDPSKIISATALMEDAKSGHLETTFGGKHKEIEISDIHIVVLSNNAPDLSVLSVDRWRLWRLGGRQYENIIWPCKISPYLKKVSRRAWNIRWTVSIRNLSLEELKSLKQYESISFDESWLMKEGNNFEIFGETTQYVKDLVTNMTNSPNYIKIQAMQFMERIDGDSIIDFTLHT